MSVTSCADLEWLEVATIEIQGPTQEEACLKKWSNVFQLISTLFCEVKRGFVDP
jgi:hypothetical protein